MNNLIALYVVATIVMLFTLNAISEPITDIQVQEWDDVYIITNGNNEIIVDCVPDVGTTEDIEGFCNVMSSTYWDMYE
jgi:transcriptional regulatory protein LevR|tara:strand:+ start:316 stop:549 length:234 start_codon:yes stop_codon:yes gene_type:complete